jgi:Tfp pilus assembly protein PilX
MLQTAALPLPQRGVVLVISLVLLVLISLLAVTSLRNAGSSENVAGNARTAELATQAADIALRHCEASVLKLQLNAYGDTVSPEATYATTFGAANILPAMDPPTWQRLATWDSVSMASFVLPLSAVNQTGVAATTYKRPPECMVEQISTAGAAAGPQFYVITARGFGPEVGAANAVRSRPSGSEVWLQSHIELQ